MDKKSQINLFPKKIKKEKKIGKKHPNNNLNDLTGSEWTFATKTVINKIFPINLQHKLRSEHGGQKPPELCSDLIKTFTKEEQTVLDPLAGVGGTLIGAELCNRKAIGIEINPKWVNIYKKVCLLEKIKEQKIITGDVNNELLKIKNESIDFILTDVPYWNMDSLKKTRGSRANKSKLSQFNKTSNQSKEKWLNEMYIIFEKCFKPLKNGKYMAVFIGDIYREKNYHILSAELANVISKIKGFVLKANLIWFDNSKSLHVYGYPYAFIPSMIHQNILIFKKEDLLD